jgi:hypothetical protein
VELERVNKFPAEVADKPLQPAASWLQHDNQQDLHLTSNSNWKYFRCRGGHGCVAITISVTIQVQTSCYWKV